MQAPPNNSREYGQILHSVLGTVIKGVCIVYTCPYKYFQSSTASGNGGEVDVDVDVEGIVVLTMIPASVPSHNCFAGVADGRDGLLSRGSAVPVVTAGVGSTTPVTIAVMFAYGSPLLPSILETPPSVLCRTLHAPVHQSTSVVSI